MKKLIGSIITVAVLISVSFTSVVGYRSVASDVKASPLFNIRNRRALDEENKVLTSEYVGKDETYLITFPKLDSTALYIKDAINIITDMDDITYTKFIDLLLKRMYQDKVIQKGDIPNIMVKLHQFKTNPDKIKNELFDSIDKIWTLDDGEECIYTNGAIFKIMCFSINFMIKLAVLMIFYFAFIAGCIFYSVTSFLDCFDQYITIIICS
jgi:hypothetical protein